MANWGAFRREQGGDKGPRRGGPFVAFPLEQGQWMARNLIFVTPLFHLSLLVHVGSYWESLLSGNFAPPYALPPLIIRLCFVRCLSLTTSANIISM